jgi:DNA-binding MarR family transcriptional regulator
MAAYANAKEELKKTKKQAAEDMKGTNLFGVLFFREQIVLRARPIAA